MIVLEQVTWEPSGDLEAGSSAYLAFDSIVSALSLASMAWLTDSTVGSLNLDSEINQSRRLEVEEI